MPIDHYILGVGYQLKPGYTSLDSLKYNTAYVAEQFSLWQEGQISQYDETFSGISFLNWRQMLGNDSALINLAQQAIGNSTNVVDETKLSFLSDYTVAQVEMVFADGLIGPPYPAEDDPLYGSDFITIAGVSMRPIARGSVHIRSANISQGPDIDPRYMSSKYDIQAQVEAVKFARKIAQTKPLADFLAGEYVPGLESVTSDDEWAGYVAKYLDTIFHYAGTCAMLPLEDGGVVDPRLRVWGTRNLRVVDASVIPVLIASHTQSVVYGIAELAAEIIIEDNEGL